MVRYGGFMIRYGTWYGMPQVITLRLLGRHVKLL